MTHETDTKFCFASSNDTMAAQICVIFLVLTSAFAKEIPDVGCMKALGQVPSQFLILLLWKYHTDLTQKKVIDSI